MSQPYQNSPSQAYGAGFGQAYYPPQLPYGQRPPYSPAAYPQHAAHAPAPFQPVPNPSSNLVRFDTNSQPPQPFPFPAGTFPPEMLKQFASAGIPPPPPGFPHMPLPNLNFPQFPHQHTHSPSQQQYQQQNQISDDGADAYDPRFPQSILHNVRAGTSATHPPTMTPETARIQTQEGGSASSHTVSQGEYSTDQQQAYSRMHFPANLDGNALPLKSSSSSLTFEAGAMLSVEPQAPVLPINEDRASTHQEEQNTVNNTNLRQAPAAGSLPMMNLSSQPALPTHVQSTQDSQTSAQIDSTNQPDYKSKPMAELRSLAKVALLSFVPHGIQYDDLVKEGINSEVLKQLYNELGMKSGPSPGPANSAQAAFSDADTNLSRPVDKAGPEAIPVSTVSPSLERKDRIAQLLAAKTARSGPVRSPPESKQSGTILSQPTPSVQNASQSVSDEGSPSVTLGQGKAQAELIRQKMEQSRRETSRKRGVTASVSASLQTALPPALPSTNTLSSAFTSGIPGLAMMSPDEESHFVSRPAKRPFQMDAQTPSLDSAHKRRNTGLSSKTDGEAMDIDDGSSDDASEGEVVESPRPSKGLRKSEVASPPVNPPPTTSQPKPFVASTTARLTPAQMAEKAEMLKAKFLKQRARQKALQDGLPTLNAEVSKTEYALSEQRASLERTRQRIAGLEADLSKARQEEQNVIDEIDRSKRRLQEGLSGREKYTEELQNLTNEEASADRGAVHSGTSTVTTVPTGTMENVAQNKVVLPDQLETSKEAEPTEVAATEEADDQLEGASHVESGTDQSLHTSSEEMSEDDEPVENGRANSEPSNDEGEYIPQEPEECDQLSRVSPIPDADESDGSASMSDSASEMDQDDGDEGEYEPPEDDPTQPMEIDDGSSIDYEPTDTPIDLQAVQDEVHEDANQAEPGEAVSLQPESGVTSPATAASINGAPSVIQHGLDLLEQQGALADSEPIRVNDVTLSHVASRNSAPATPNPRMGRSRPPARPLSNDGKSKSNNFSAYQSPLTSFPAYRHHQLFDDNAKDGYRSLTYSNRIDPSVPLCPTELAGETCQDPQCEEQHFRHFGLSDDKILAQMSSASDFKDKGVRDRYLSGLRDAIADLRVKGIKDFEDVAKALAKYRRDFLTEQ